MHVIHYHGTPFSGVKENHLALQGKHAMVSFATPQHGDIVAEVCQSFCLDNGAFSAWQKGDRFGLNHAHWDKYREWAEGWLRHPGCDFAIIPDVIDGTEQENDQMVSRWWSDKGYNGWVPVWHMHESIDRLVRLCDDWPRVALGSSGEYAKIGDDSWWGRMAEAMDEITDDDGFPVTKLHGLRMLDPGLASYIPFSSADSTNVARNIGIDIRWTGSYSPSSKRARAIVMMERIESHAVAARWCNKPFIIKQANLDLLG